MPGTTLGPGAYSLCEKPFGRTLRERLPPEQ
jgi:hypothetical protein